MHPVVQARVSSNAGFSYLAVSFVENQGFLHLGLGQVVLGGDQCLHANPGAAQRRV